jgi:hypothetical protein
LNPQQAQKYDINDMQATVQCFNDQVVVLAWDPSGAGAKEVLGPNPGPLTSSEGLHTPQSLYFQQSYGDKILVPTRCKSLP